MELSVIIPCYNEERRLPGTLARVREYLDGRGEPYEILIVDDGSRDGTVAYAQGIAAEDPRVRVLQYGENHGKGYAVKFGVLKAEGERVLVSDADLSTPIEELEKLEPWLERGFDVVIGSRALAESRLEVRQPWWRERLGRFMNRCICWASGMAFPDTQCGFKLFSRRAAQWIFPHLTVERWMFDVEVLVLAGKQGLPIKDVPIVWRNSDESRVRLSHTASVFAELIWIKTHWLRRQPSKGPFEETEVAAQPTP